VISFVNVASPCSRSMNVRLSTAKRALKAAAQKALGHQSWNSDDDQIALLGSPRIIFDIGANTGQTATRYRDLFPDAHIFSFEPDFETFKKLEANFSGDSHVSPIPFALSDKQELARMYIMENRELNSFLPASGDWAKTEKVIETQTTTVDLFCRERGIEQIDILKVDAQGAEMAIFRGAAGIFEKRAVRAIFTEVYFDPVYAGMPVFADLDVELRNHGFHLHGIYSLTAGSDGHLDLGNALYYLE